MTMKRILPLLALLALAGVGANLSAQQTSTPRAPDNASHQQNSANVKSQQAAHNYEGTITRAGDQFVLQEATSRTIYGLDDQTKAKQYVDKTVTVVATMDPATDTLHVMQITVTDTQ
jgi:hypothetical protein